MTDSPRPASDPRARTLRLLLWRMVLAGEKEREKIRTQLMANDSLPVHVVSGEAGSPSSVVRLEALRILEGRLSSSQIEAVLPLLYDYNVDVRDQARRTLSCFVVDEDLQPGTTDRSRTGQDIASLYGTLEEVLRTSSELNTASVLELLFSLAVENPDEFWSFYGKTTDRVRTTIYRSFLVRTDVKIRQILFSGLLCDSGETVKSVQGFLERTFSRAMFQTDVEALMSFAFEVRRRILTALDKAGQLSYLADRILRIRPDFRPELIAHLRELDASKYAKCFSDALTAEDPETLKAALHAALGQDLPGLASDVVRLLSDEDLEVVGAAVQYLGRHGSSAHVRDLIPLLSKESTDVGQAAAEAVYKLTREHLLENYNDLPVKSRESLTTLLTKLDKGFALSLIEEFRTADSEKKNNIISILELFHELDETVQEEILKMTDDPDSRVRATVARTLGRIQAFHDRYIAGLKLLYDEDARVRANAVEGATKDSPEFRERILELSEDGEPRERANAIRQLFVWQEPLASDRLDRFIADPSPNARLSVAWLLGELSFPLYETVLWDFVKDENPSIRIRAIKSLEKVAPDERIRELMFVFEDPEFAVRQAAREVIRSRLNLDYEEVD